MDTAEAALARLCDPDIEVSAHYLIGETGVIWQMVDEDMRAWHAGAGQWGGCCDVNSASIGIELANTGRHPFSALQMTALEGLMRAIMQRWDIAASGVIAHSDMAPDRKVDPGSRFDWCRLARAGLSVWPATGTGADTFQKAPDAEVFHQQVCAFGYPDVAQDVLLAAVRLRFRPWGRGVLSGEDMAVAAGLAKVSK